MENIVLVQRWYLNVVLKRRRGPLRDFGEDTVTICPADWR